MASACIFLSWIMREAWAIPLLFYLRDMVRISLTCFFLFGNRDQLPATVETKRLQLTPNNPADKGDLRRAKHTKQGPDVERYATEGPSVDLQHSEEGLLKRENVDDDEIDRIVESRERK